MTESKSTFSQEEIVDRLQQLRSEHRDLDEVIERLGEDALANQLQITRLKKRKLQLKDVIARYEAMLIPDIIA